MTSQLVNEVKTFFLDTFKVKPLLVFSPGRINIIGEHTDYNEGFVFPAAVNKGIVAAVQKTKNKTTNIFALDLESSIDVDITNIQPAKKGSWENYVLGIVAEIKKRGKKVENFNLVFKGNIPSGAGISSSAAIENAVVFALNELFNFNFTKEEMILISQKAEHNYVGVNCGIMDQYSSMFGIEDHALLLDCRTITSKAYKIDFKSYQFILVNTNVKHSLSDSAYNERRATCEAVSKLLSVKALRDVTIDQLESVKNKIHKENYEKALYVIKEIERTKQACLAIEDNDLGTLGNLLFKSHEGLSKRYKVSCNELDFLVEFAKANPYVLGARMMGGGFGGCTINLIAKDEVKNFTKKVSKAYLEVFGKSCSVYNIKLSQGTHLIE